MKNLGRIRLLPGRVVACILFLWSLVYLSETPELSTGSFAFPGPGVAPLFLGISMLILSVILLLFFQDHGNWGRISKRSWLLGVGMVIFSMAFNRVGYLLVTFGLLIFGFKVMGARSLFFLLFLSVSLTITSYIIFKFFFYIPLPSGILSF
jgi:hypothetical protein